VLNSADKSSAMWAIDALRHRRRVAL
jgi:hypothetical protein